MARPVQTDFLHSFRFQVTSELVDGKYDPLAVKDRPEAGFNSVTVPEITIESVEYKEGLDIYPRKYPGAPTIGSELTLSRGVAYQDTSFWSWARVVVEGKESYRTTLAIHHYHRVDFGTYTYDDISTGSSIANTGKPTGASRTYMVYEAFPVRHKPGADMDATSSEVSLMELDVAFEYFDVFSK